VRCLAIPDRIVEHGDPDAIKRELGLDAAGIAAAIRALLAGA
jgi:1-deoxy-D-xylulose-5-phosphate synthase